MPSKIGRVVFRSVQVSLAMSDTPASTQALGLEGSPPCPLLLERPSQAPDAGAGGRNLGPSGLPGSPAAAAERCPQAAPAE